MKCWDTLVFNQHRALIVHIKEAGKWRKNSSFWCTLKHALSKTYSYKAHVSRVLLYIIPADVECRKGESIILWRARGGAESWGDSLVQALGMWLGGETRRRTAHGCVWVECWWKLDLGAEQPPGLWLHGLLQRQSRLCIILGKVRGGRILVFITTASSFPKTTCQALVLASHSAKESFKSTAVSNCYHSAILQVRCIPQLVLTVDITLLPYIITDIWYTIQLYLIS